MRVRKRPKLIVPAAPARDEGEGQEGEGDQRS